jgi:hypothetical protein
MIGPVHPEVLRELQHERRDEIHRALRGCRRVVRQRRGDRR